MKKRKKTKEEVLEVVENVEKDTIEEGGSAEISEEMSETTAQEVSEAISEEELKEISEAIAEETSEISEETSAEGVSDDISQEISEAFAEELSEEVSEEGLGETTEEVSEEGSEEVTEEGSEEGSGDNPCEADSAENQDEGKEEKKVKKISKKAIIIISAVVAVLAAAYLGVALYFSNYFLMGTSVNGVDCTGKTVKEVKNILQSQVEKYTLTIEEKNGVTEEIKGVDIGIKYKGADVIEDAFEKQNPYAWIVSVFKGKDIKADIDFEYDSAKLDEVIGQLSCLKEENQVAPVSATPVYKDGVYEIQEEVYGSQIHSENLYAAIQISVAAMKTTVNLEEEQCYVQPTFTKDSKEVIAARDGLNKCLKASITYSLDGVNVTVDKAMISGWLSVDANMAVIINADQVRAFTNSLGTTYNTPNTAAEITTPNGKAVSIPNGRLGRVVGSAAECDQLMNEIRSGAQLTREPILSQQATPEGTTRWGATYIEVDIAQQHVWYIVNGAVALEFDVVTGAPGLDTPVGYFTVLEKLSPKVLRGNIVPETGRPEYETPVKYWVRVTWSGVGFHDATWQSAFGGELYRQGFGSHGCINTPYATMEQFYNMVYVGCPILIHY